MVIQRLTTVIATLSNFIDAIAKKLAIFLIGVLVVLVLVTVFFRYVLSVGIGWSDEVARYMNIWVALLGASIAFKSGEHVGVEFFRNLLPEKAAKIMKFVTNIAMLALLGLSEYYCYLYVARSRAVTPSLQIPYKWIQMSIFVGLAIMTIHLLGFLIKDINHMVSGTFFTPPEKKEDAE
jgi:TRAP-type C4-dicarboxylate transport system permease small subunit